MREKFSKRVRTTHNEDKRNSIYFLKHLIQQFEQFTASYLVEDSVFKAMILSPQSVGWCSSLHIVWFTVGRGWTKSLIQHRGSLYYFVWGREEKSSSIVPLTAVPLKRKPGLKSSYWMKPKRLKHIKMALCAHWPSLVINAAFKALFKEAKQGVISWTATATHRCAAEHWGDVTDD